MKTLIILAAMVVSANLTLAQANQMWITGPSRTVLSFLKTPQGKPYVTVDVNGKSLNFLIDTGGMTLVDLQVAKEIGVEIREAGDVATTLTGSGGLRHVTHVNLGIGKLKLTNLQVSCIDLAYFKGLEKPELTGIIGTDLLSLLKAKVDYAEGTLTLNRPKG